MAGAARDVAVDMAVLLQASRDAGGDKGLERPKDGRPSDARIVGSKPVVDLLRRQPTICGAKGVRDQQPLAGYPLAGTTQAVGRPLPAQWTPTAPAKTEKP